MKSSNPYLLLCLAIVLIVLMVPRETAAQLAPTGGHYAGRASDTGYGGTFVNATGTYAASIPLDLPAERTGLPVPLQISYGGHGVGAAGLGWDIPLSYIRRDRTFAFRRPEFGNDVLPTPRERVQLSLLGQSFELVQQGEVWVTRSGTLELTVRESAGSWLAFDGQGRTYTFLQAAPLASTGLWLLKSVSVAGGADLQLTYDITTRQVDGGIGTEIDLSRITYNTHPTAGCAKHEVALTYGNVSVTPLSLSTFGGKILARHRTLARVDVNSRATCAAAFQHLRSYELKYLEDPDTKLPRLRTVRVRGRQGTPEENTPLPVASYDYGTATKDGQLRYERTQTIALPPSVDLLKISGTARDTSVAAPEPGTRYATWQTLTDVTGDGRPDLVFKKNNRLWVAFNRPGPNGKTTIGVPPVSGQPTVPLSDATFHDGAFSTHSSRQRRFSYFATHFAANRNTVNVWRQAIDINGDGRIDIIDAAEQPKHWVIYLNTPGGPNGVKWERRSFHVGKLGIELVTRGHALDPNFVPLSRRSTGGNISTWTCWRWDWDDKRYKWYPDGLHNHLCRGVDGEILAREPEQTFVEWELTDLNGDGYPDFVFNSSPVDFQLTEPDSLFEGNPTIFDGQRLIQFGLRQTNQVRASYNLRGVRFSTDVDPFSRSVSLQAQGSEFGVGVWTNGGTTSEQFLWASFADVNGDGLADRVVGKQVFLGTYLGTARAFSGVFITLPGPLATQSSGQQTRCATAPRFAANQTQGLRDLTGDGIPDYYDKGRVWVGTGTGFTKEPIGIQGAFVFSHQTETCDGDISNTDGGLYDIDGDGKPEVVGLAGQTLVVSQLSAGTTLRVPEAGRLTMLDNGYGARTFITYVSAKDDLWSSHRVPFPEIVVARVETAGIRNLGGNLAGSRYAYGGAELVFDSALDRFIFPGYQRFVELRLYGKQGERPEGFATVTDKWPLTPFQLVLTKKDRWLRTQRVGRDRDIYTLRGTSSLDPWPLLGVDSNDGRVIGVTHFEWDAKLYELPATAGTGGFDCFDMVKPLDFGASLADIGENMLDACRAHGFVYGLSSESWFGASQPPSNNNVQTRSRALAVDDFGRVTFAQYENDLFRGGDDVCVENKFATPTGTFPRVLTALASRSISDCAKRITYASESFSYDSLAAGLVSNGRMTSHNVERRTPDNGVLLRNVRTFDATYDVAGNLASLSTQRDGATRTVTFEYDSFGLVPIHSKVEATGVPSTEASVTYDPVSLEALGSTDDNGTQGGAAFDGFGRLLRSTVTPAGRPEGVVSTVSYQGFSGTDPNGRRIVVKTFGDAVAPSEVATAAGRTGTLFLDELGRERRSELALGSDYANEVIVVGSRVYDRLGRVAFQADPYPASQNAATAYGTSYYFKNTGDVDCIIRGRGQQALSEVTDVATERFPTCFDRSFVNHVNTLEVRDAASLQPGSPQAGVVRRVVSTAIGRVTERSIVKAGVRLDFAAFTHDRLGRQTSMTRFLDPVGGTNPVSWSWRLDSIGQTLKLEEPETAPRFFTYSDWGELAETNWTDGAIDRRLVSRYDSLGRLTATEERNNGVADAETVNTYAYDVGVKVSPQVTPTFVLGRLARATSPSGQVAFSYDAFGRVNARTFTDNQAGLYVEKTNYHADGRLDSLVFNLPDQGHDKEQVRYAYDSAGRTREIKYDDATGTRELYRAETIDPFGRVRKALYGGNTSYRAVYADEGRRLKQEASVDSSLGSRRVIFLGFDPLGRELSRREIKDRAATGPKTNVTYDALGRLGGAVQTEGTTTLFNWRFSYDTLGNITNLGDVSGAADAALSYRPGDPDRVCRVGYGNGGLGGATCNVQHDTLGNVISQPTRTGSRQLSYYSSGGIRTITEQGTQARFAYDAFGQVQELDLQGSAALDKRRDRRYGGLIERRDTNTGGGSSSFITRHIPGPGGIVASRRGAGDEWVFGFGELRGSRFFTDKDGSFLQDINYAPYGEAKSSGVQPGSANYTSYQWNGGDALAAFGLSHLGARVYDPVIGRFLSRDPLLIPRGAATSNPYAFAMNDPSNGADPSGLDCNGNFGQECQFYTPLFPFGSGGGGSGGGGGGSGSPLPAPQQAPLASKGPQTDAGKQLQFDVAIVTGTWVGNAFDFDKVASWNLDIADVLDRVTMTPDVHATIDARNANIDTFSSGFAGFGDALNWTCFWPICSGSEGRADLGITSGDADQSAYRTTNITTSVGMLVLPFIKSSALGINSTSITRAEALGGGGGGSTLRGEATAAEVVGRRGAAIEIQAGRNTPTTIGGRAYSGHALDRMQGRGQVPSVVENTIQHGQPSPGSFGTTRYFDPVNRTTVLVDTASGRVITVY